MNSSVTLSEKNWAYITDNVPDKSKFLTQFEFELRIHKDYRAYNNDYIAYPTQKYELIFKNERSYTYFILKYGNLISTSLD